MKIQSFPEKLQLRKTERNDDLGGLGQPIFTTSGQGYDKVEYVRGDLFDKLLLQVEDLLEVNNLKTRQTEELIAMVQDILAINKQLVNKL